MFFVRISLISACIFLIVGVGYFFASKKDVPEFASQYIEMMEKHPSFVVMHIKDTWQGCIPSNEQIKSATQPVLSLVAETIARSILFTAQGKSSEQASKELIPWLLGEAKSFSTEEKDIFMALVRRVNNVDVQFCVISSLRISPKFLLTSSVGEWALRR